MLVTYWMSNILNALSTHTYYTHYTHYTYIVDINKCNNSEGDGDGDSATIDDWGVSNIDL